MKKRYIDREKGMQECRRAQAWGIDLIIGVTIFTVCIVVFYFYALNAPGESKENLDSLFYDGNIIADSVLSEGYPKDWDVGNVVTIGILSDNKINETKLERFYNLNSTDYEQTKILLNTNYDYFFSLSENMVINALNVGGIGLNYTNPRNLIKITRFSIYKNKPVTVYFYVWE